MNTRTDQRVSRQVRLLDIDAAQPMLAAIYEAIYGEPSRFSVMPQAIVAAWNPDAWGVGAVDVATICTEGVGEFLSDENTLGIWCTDKGRDFHIPLALHRVPLTDDGVDFADFVRSFGARLESNWSLWEGRMAQADLKGIPTHMTRLTLIPGSTPAPGTTTQTGA